MIGRLGDLRGRRSVMIGVMVVVLVGSVLAAVTTSLPLLLLARVLQATIFGLSPLLIAMLREELPPERLTGAMALISGTIAVGAGVGVAVTGFFMRSGGDYHELFWLSSALTVVGLLGFLTLPRRAAATTGRLDWTGAAVLGLGLVLLVMPLEQGNTWGWSSPATLGSVAGAAVLLAIFVLVERPPGDRRVRLRVHRARRDPGVSAPRYRGWASSPHRWAAVW